MSSIDRRKFIRHVAATSALAAAGVPPLDASETRSPAPPLSRSPDRLADPAFRPLPLGAIKPRGWLARQLRIQADALSGHIDEFWPDIAQSKWFGGTAEGWERAPYWMDGAVALAWTLDDAALKAKVSAHVRQVLAAQRPDGTWGPMAEWSGRRPYDVWAVFLVDKMLAQYHEATLDERAFAALEASLKQLQTSVATTPLFEWGKYRWFEALIPVFYVYERTGEPWLLDLARTLRAQGKDYAALFASELITQPTPRRGRWIWDRHGVNSAMALKAGALAWRLGGRAGDRALPDHMLAVLDRYHGQVTGMFTADECLSGKNPLQGTELCTVVEYMYSCETLMSVLGEASWADRLERVAFNALPAAISPDMWTHQYDQQVNQAQCTLNQDHMWGCNGPEANLFGLSPEYGCCTSNYHQGWPKLTSHLWMKTADGGIAAVAYAPSEAKLEAHGVAVGLALDTEYPFRDTLDLTVTADSAVTFPLLLRVPGWAEGASVQVGEGTARPVRAGAFHRIERRWGRGPTSVRLRFPMRPKVTVRYNDAIALERGPLVYSLKIDETWTRIHADQPQRELPHGDFEVTAAAAWNYGLVLDPAHPEQGVTFEEKPLGERPFSPEGAGIVAHVEGRKLPNWKLERGWAAELAPEDTASDQPREALTLIPYGCTNIRITEFPRLMA